MGVGEVSLLTMYNQRSNTGGSFGEILETLKIEYDKLAKESTRYKLQRDEFERKLQSQLVELSSIHKSVQELEHRHTKLKLQYEEDLYRLQQNMQSQRTQPGTSHRDQLFGEKKDQTTFPALTQGQNQQDPNVFGFQSSLGKRKYEDSGFLGGQTLPRLEMPASIASDNGSSGRFPQIHNNHSNENRLNSNSPSIKSVSPK